MNCSKRENGLQRRWKLDCRHRSLRAIHSMEYDPPDFRERVANELQHTLRIPALASCGQSCDGIVDGWRGVAELAMVLQTSSKQNVGRPDSLKKNRKPVSVIARKGSR